MYMLQLFLYSNADKSITIYIEIMFTGEKTLIGVIKVFSPMKVYLFNALAGPGRRHLRIISLWEALVLGTYCLLHPCHFQAKPGQLYLCNPKPGQQYSIFVTPSHLVVLLYTNTGDVCNSKKKKFYH